jgi:predicted dienelactone hydrolase
MVPFYILAALVLASRMPALLGRASMVRRGRDVLASVVTVLILVLAGVFAGWLLPVIALPQPTGPYRVGIIDRELVDEVRGRRLMVSVWYPAVAGGTSAPLTHHLDEVMAALANLAGLPAPLFQHLRYITLAASEGVPALANSTPFPILVFSHGLVGLRLQNSSTLQELASWGYVDAVYWLELPNSTHYSFTFSQLLSPLLVPQGFEPRAGLRVVDKYLRAFFDTHLRSVPTRLLGPASRDTDVRWHTK